MPRYIIFKILVFLRRREFSEETYPNCLIWKVQLAMLPTSVEAITIKYLYYDTVFAAERTVIMGVSLYKKSRAGWP